MYSTRPRGIGDDTTSAPDVGLALSSYGGLVMVLGAAFILYAVWKATR